MSPAALGVVLALGTTGAGGMLDAALTVPELGPGIQALALHAQGLFLDAGGAALLGSVSHAVLLDASV